ncbi:MAG: hypothetical protein HFI92_00550 [Lachnospiraceae bacterium]|nr:hypothetical protein [Lachnospiraceae bacterium]
MKMRMVKGMAAALCMAMLATTTAAVAPGGAMVASAEETGNGTTPGGSNTTTTEDLEKEKQNALNAFDDWITLNLKTNDPKVGEVDKKIQEAKDIISKLKSADAVKQQKEKTLSDLNGIINGSTGTGSGTIIEDGDDDDEDDNNNDEDPPVNPDHFLMVGGSWVTPVANAGQTISVVLPVVNMGKTMVTDAVVTPVLSTDTASWPFEITSSNYSQTIPDLPGTDTGMNDMDRRRELTWELKARSDIGSGYQKLSFDVRYRDSDGESQTATLDTYIQLKGTAGVGADGKSSVPRVIVTGFETNPEEVHAGESFMLTLHLQNTSTATSVNNMVFEIEAAVEGKDEETTYAAFLPTAGSSTIFVDRMEKNGTKDIQIEMEAKADLAQKPYAVDVNMSYEDEHVNAYTSTSSVSIPVKQQARVDISSPEVMPGSITVGSEANVMFNIYNMGKTKLYNVQVKMNSDTISGGDAFVGNLDPGATGAVDIYVTGQSPTMDDGIVKIQITYEDESGASTAIDKEISLFVSEASMDDMMGDDYMMDDVEIEGEGGGTTSTIVTLVIIGVIVAAVAFGVFYTKRKKKKEQMSLEEDLLDSDDETDE